MASKAKVNLYQLVVPGVIRPHKGNDLSNGPDIFLNRALLDEDTPRGKKEYTHTLGKDLEE